MTEKNLIFIPENEVTKLTPAQAYDRARLLTKDIVSQNLKDLYRSATPNGTPNNRSMESTERFKPYCD